MIKIVFSINNSITNDVDNVEVLNKSEKFFIMSMCKMYLRTKYSSSGELSFFMKFRISIIRIDQCNVEHQVHSTHMTYDLSW